MRRLPQLGPIWHRMATFLAQPTSTGASETPKGGRAFARGLGLNGNVRRATIDSPPVDSLRRRLRKSHAIPKTPIQLGKLVQIAVPTKAK
jgi:hypothetical protein